MFPSRRLFFGCFQFLVLLDVEFAIGGAFAWTAEETGPVFIAEPQTELTFLHSKGGTLHCSGHGAPTPDQQWLIQDHPRHPITSSHLVTVLSNGSLTFHPFTAEQYDPRVHANTYMCKLTNAHGSIISTPVRVTARLNENFVLPRVYDAYVIRGNTAVFKCILPAYTKDFTEVVSWLVNNEKILLDKKGNSKYSMMSSGSLHIFDAQPSDQHHTYKCQSKDKITGRIQTSSDGASLHITESSSGLAPKINDFIPKLLLKKGESSLIPCVAQGYPIPQYKWSFTGIESKNEAVSKQKTTPSALFIENAEVEDEGSYHCNAENKFGTDSQTTQVVVSVPLEAYIEPEKIKLDIGQALRILCKTSGRPIEHIRWFKDSQRIETTGNILLKNITDVQDVGSYQCFVGNTMETVQASTYVFAGDMPPRLVTTFESSLSSPGANVEFGCSAKGKPRPSILWTRDGQPVSRSSKLLIADDVTADGGIVSKVRIKNINVEDSGIFECIAQNRLSKVSHSENIKVYGLPVIRQMKNITVVAGQNASIQCHVLGYPIKSVRWTKGKNQLKSTRKYSDNDGLMRIYNIHPIKDKGKYTCTAVSSSGHKRSQDIWINVYVKPKIMKNFQHLEYPMQDTMSLHCAITKGNQPIRFHWTLNGEVIDLSSGFMISESSKFSVLQIDELQEHHSGNYTCTASNVAGNDTWVINVRIKVPPKIIIKPTDQWKSLGNDVLFDCSAKGNPKPGIEWQKEQDPVEESFHRKIFTNGSLLIRNIESTDEGTYRCIATNRLEPSATAEAHLYVGEAITIDGSNQVMETEENVEVSLQCTIHGLLPSTIKWQSDGKPLLKSERYEIRTEKSKTKLKSLLRISGFNRRDPSRYECVGQNRFGTRSRGYQIKLKGFGGQEDFRRTVPMWESVDGKAPEDIWKRKKDKSELNEAPAISYTTVGSDFIPKESQKVISSSSKEESQEGKVTFLQILIASVTTAVIILLFVLLLVLIILWKRRSDRNEMKSQYYEAEMLSNRGSMAESQMNTLDRRYGHLRPRSARSCETLTGSGYYTSISPYATFDPKEPESVEDGQSAANLSRRISDAPSKNF